jgi:hypothetical protein
MKKVLIVLAVILLAAWGGFMLLKSQAKSKSPESGVNFAEGDLKIHVYYNQPSKRGREIFAEDGLVPWGKVWRTGANEATYLETNKRLLIKGKELKPGRYSLWTIPNRDSWVVIFNNEIPSWGINFNGENNYDPARDELRVEVPTLIQDKEFELFTISIERVDDEIELIFLWDKTLVSVPFTVAL